MRFGGGGGGCIQRAMRESASAYWDEVVGAAGPLLIQNVQAPRQKQENSQYDALQKGRRMPHTHGAQTSARPRAL